MDYAKFRRLIAEGEKATVDFKIECGAFTSPGIAEKAELAKDIISMCNNGNVKSYILVGVSDDGKGFRSVANKKLTDDNLQDFCKTTITPPPKVFLRRVRWPKALPCHRGIEFVIIEIGPNRRSAFCFAREMINYSEKYCFKRNEVWIRRGATSDLPTPLEIARLVQGKPIHEEHDEATRVARESFEAASVLSKEVFD